MIFDSLDERARPMTPTKTITAKATLRTSIGGSNGGTNVASDKVFPCVFIRI